jgi:hypothetical protein
MLVGFQDLPLGCRIWCRPDAGAKFEIPDKDKDPEIKKVHSVGIAYSTKIVPLIEQGLIHVDRSGGHKKLCANLNASSPQKSLVSSTPVRTTSGKK